MVPVIVLFKNQPSLNDIKSHKQIDYTDDIELIKHYGGNVTKTWNIIHAAAVKIPKDKVLLLANNTLVASIDPDSPGKIADMIPSPLKQLKLGIMAKDVQCNQGFVSVIKISDNSPACVKPDTVQKLIERELWILNEQTILVQIKTTMFCNPWDKDLTQWYHLHNQTRMSESQGLEIIKNYYKKQGISVFDTKYVNWRPHTLSCDACSCDSGRALQLLIENSDLGKMEKQGFSIVK